MQGTYPSDIVHLREDHVYQMRAHDYHWYTPCFTREFVAIGLLAVSDPADDVESLRFAALRFLYVSKGLVVLSDCSMDRVNEGMGPALVCRLLNGEKRE